MGRKGERGDSGAQEALDVEVKVPQRSQGWLLSSALWEDPWVPCRRSWKEKSMTPPAQVESWVSVGHKATGKLSTSSKGSQNGRDGRHGVVVEDLVEIGASRRV